MCRQLRAIGHHAFGAVWATGEGQDAVLQIN